MVCNGCDEDLACPRPLRQGARLRRVNAKKTDADIEKYHALDGVIDYAADSDKTEKCFFVSGVNCLPENAKEAFAATQKRYGKTTGKVAYHMYQSFTEGEVDADTAHKIGVKLAEEVFGDRFEALVATRRKRKTDRKAFSAISSTARTAGKSCGITPAPPIRISTFSPVQTTKRTIAAPARPATISAPTRSTPS